MNRVPSIDEDRSTTFSQILVGVQILPPADNIEKKTKREMRREGTRKKRKKVRKREREKERKREKEKERKREKGKKRETQNHGEKNN